MMQGSNQTTISMDALAVEGRKTSERSQRPNLRERILIVAAVVLGIFQAGRLFWVINRYSVDVLFWDQWDYYRAFFTPHTLWEIFSWQHGMHRQGIGFFLTWMVNELTAWDQRAQCFAMGLVMLAAAAAALWLKRRLFGRLAWHDVILVLLILSPRQWELYAGAPNVSPQAMPVLLIVLLCVAWTVRQVYLRYSLVLVLTFLATYTGFGLFVGLLVPLLLAADLWRGIRQRSGREMTMAGVALALSLVSLGSFFIGYHFSPDVDHFQFPDPNWPLYPTFMSLQFAGLFGVVGSGGGTIAVGFVILGGFLVLLVTSGARMLRGTAGQDTPARVVFFLLAFTMAFSANAAIGRLRLGLETAASSRYYALLMPAALALYLALLSRPAGRVRQVLTILLLLCTVFATMRMIERGSAKGLSSGKLRWVAACLEAQQVSGQLGAKQVQAINEKAGFRVHPAEGKRFAARVEWLRARRYSFFRDVALPASRPSVGPATAPAVPAVPAVTAAGQ